jgi:hypothetical protein
MAIDGTALELLRRQLADMIEARGAHMPLDAAVAEFPADGINAIVPNGVYTPWHLLEHIRRGQSDILDYIRNRDYLAPTWPDSYWPPRDAIATPGQFDETVEQIRADRDALRRIVLDPATDLFAPIPASLTGDREARDHTILREARITAAHSAYHLGEFAILRQVMGTWPPNRRDR